MGSDTMPPRDPADDDNEDEEDEKTKKTKGTRIGTKNRRSSENPTSSCCARTASGHATAPPARLK
jgi:hypothetical protein